MSKTIIAEVDAEYDAERKALILEEPLHGVENHAHVWVSVESRRTRRKLLDSKHLLSPDAGKNLARSIRDAFGRDNIDI